MWPDQSGTAREGFVIKDSTFICGVVRNFKHDKKSNGSILFCLIWEECNYYIYC